MSKGLLINSLSSAIGVAFVLAVMFVAFVIP